MAFVLNLDVPDPNVIIVAHRYGNSIDSAPEGAEIADMVEIDVHLWHGRLEVRHAKRLWILQRQWEQWHLLPTDSPVPSFAEIVSSLPPNTPLLVDIKGWRPRMVRLIREVLGDERPIVASARGWWLLRHIRDRPHTKVLRSVGTKWQLWLVSHLPRSRAKPAPGTVVHQRLLNSRSAATLLRISPDLFTWNIESESRADELIALGVTGLIIDDAHLITLLRNGRDG